MKALVGTDDLRAVQTLIEASNLMSGGHFVLFGFTTNYKACLGTPITTANCDLDDVYHIPSFETIREAVAWALQNPRCLYEAVVPNR